MKTIALVTEGILTFIFETDDGDTPDAVMPGEQFIDITGVSPVPDIGAVYVSGTTFNELTDDQKWINIRIQRDKLLTDSDFVMATDYYNNILDAQGQTDWTAYRQDLRDIPQTYAADPDTVVWPTKP